MKNVIYNLFFIIGVLFSALGITKTDIKAIPIYEDDAAEKSVSTEKLYFSDILEKQGQDNDLLVYHYSHQSHRSHFSHQSHRSHYSGY